MRIRTITFFTNTGFPIDTAAMRRARRVLTGAKAELEAMGCEVQSLRLALPALAPLVGGDASRVVELARDVETACGDACIDYATMGMTLPGDPPAVVEALPDAIGATESIFASSLVAAVASGIDMPAVVGAAAAIDRLSRVRADGFGNLRFAALFNVPPGVPFLPAAYHDGGEPAVAAGVEAAGLAVEALLGASSWGEARARLIERVEMESARIVRALRGAADGCRVGGVDFSLAPFPDEARSIGTAIERLSGAAVGQMSTLAAVACLADAIDRARIDRAGYTGVFLPVFEDAVLAARAVEGRLRLNDLLLYSSVCGTGLDTVPLPGDIDRSAIRAVLLDVAALALRLDKPLTARLMPIPGKRAGDEVRFDFPYFAPARVLSAEGPARPGLLATAQAITIGPRGRI